MLWTSHLSDKNWEGAEGEIIGIRVQDSVTVSPQDLVISSALLVPSDSSWVLEASCVLRNETQSSPIVSMILHNPGLLWKPDGSFVQRTPQDTMKGKTARRIECDGSGHALCYLAKYIYANASGTFSLHCKAHLLPVLRVEFATG